MNLNFSKVIQDIEDSLKPEYLGGCIQWADETHNNAWSNAIDRLDNSILQCMQNDDEKTLKAEIELYKSTCLRLIEKFKHEHHTTAGEDLVDFLSDQPAFKF